MSAHRLPLLAPPAAVWLLHAAILLWLPAQLPAFQPPQPPCTHVGPLVLRGTEVFTIANTTFVQCGPIEVHDQAQLVIRDATVEFRHGYMQQFHWSVDGSAQLIIERSRVWSPYEYALHISGSARARFVNSALPGIIAPGGLAEVAALNSDLQLLFIPPLTEQAAQRPTISISGGTINALGLRSAGELLQTVRDLRRDQNLTWSPDDFRDARKGVRLVNVRVNNVGWDVAGNSRTTFVDCDLTHVSVADTAVILLRNSRVVSPVLFFQNNHRITLRGLTSLKTITHWSLQEADPTTNVPFDYIIDNSRVDGWLIFGGGDVTLEGCDLHGPTRLQPGPGNPNAIVRVIRTYVTEFWPWRSDGTVGFEGAQVEHVQSPVDSSLTITGTVRFEKKAIDAVNGPWRKSTITRKFPVRVVDMNGIPLAGASLRLVDRTGKVTWTGQTLADGSAEFAIVFRDDNHADTWYLGLGTDERAATMPVQFLSDTPLVFKTPTAAPFTSRDLQGKYHFVQLLTAAPEGLTSTVAGTLSFDGLGSYTYTAEGTPATAQGTYSVGGAGDVAMVSPIRKDEYLSAYLSGDREVLLGSSTYCAGSTLDLFIAVRAPSADVTNRLLSGSYHGAFLELIPDTRTAVKSAVLSFLAGGDGRFSPVTVTGHASQQGGKTVTESISGATYSLKPGGSGGASFGAASSLLSGDRTIFVSQGGTYVVGHLAGRGLWLAAKAADARVPFEGRYWVARLLLGNAGGRAASGSLRTLGAAQALVVERVRRDGEAMEYSGLNSYALHADGTGALAQPLPVGLTNMALVAPLSLAGATRAGAFVGAEVGPVGQSTSEYGLFFGVRAPGFGGTGVFLDPAGVMNGASFAGWPQPVAPGAIVSLFGSGLAAREAQATGYPLPTRLDDVTVTVNGLPAPLYYVSPTQVNLQVPYGLKGTEAALRVTNRWGASNEIRAPLAATSPGVFWDSRSPYLGPVLHADYSKVTPQNPARPGETVLLWLTGLGELSPAVPSGEGSPEAPLARAADASIAVLFGGIPAARVEYAGGAPGYAGLNQINTTIPPNAPLGSNVPLAVRTSNALTELTGIPISK